MSAPRPLPTASATSVVTTPLPEGEVRKSNEVNGFEYSRVKAIWYTLRFLLVVPAFPFLPFIMAAEARDPAIAKNYFKTLAYCIKTAMIHIRHGSLVRMIKYNLFRTPETIQKAIERRKGACTRCAKCCRQYDCIFLGHDTESKEYFCKIYQTDYWYYGTCGRYPIDQKDIDDHACPGFSF